MHSKRKLYAAWLSQDCFKWQRKEYSPVNNVSELLHLVAFNCLSPSLQTQRCFSPILPRSSDNIDRFYFKTTSPQQLPSLPASRKPSLNTSAFRFFYLINMKTLGKSTTSTSSPSKPCLQRPIRRSSFHRGPSNFPKNNQTDRPPRARHLQ